MTNKHNHFECQDINCPEECVQCRKLSEAFELYTDDCLDLSINQKIKNGKLLKQQCDEALDRLMTKKHDDDNKSGIAFTLASNYDLEVHHPTCQCENCCKPILSYAVKLLRSQMQSKSSVLYCKELEYRDNSLMKAIEILTTYREINDQQ